MNTVFLILLLVAAVIVANAIFAKFQLVPVAFLQIGAGLILSTLPIYQHFELEPEIFMLVIISMLMFNDGQNTNMQQLTRGFGTTFSLAVELAAVSIIIVGAVTHFFLPSLSPALAFALGAIIVPTDAVAVSSITAKVLVPKDVMNTLENESLFNDASGIVALNLATAAVITGKFSIWAGIGNFLYVFFGGIIVGTILGSIIISLRIKLMNNHIDTPSVMVPYTLLVPFIVYLIAEAIGVSGILAVVMAGLLHGIQHARLQLTSSRLQIVMKTTWSIFASILNGIVFVLLGLSLPRVIKDLSHRDTNSIAILIGVGLTLYVLMTFLRFLWMQLGLARIRTFNAHDKLMSSIITALSGVHGTITLSLAFSLPLTMNGKAFTYRTDIIFIATVVILASLIIPTIILPYMLPKKVDNYSQSELEKAKSDMVTDSINTLLSKHPESPVVSQVISMLDGQRVVETDIDRNKLNKIFNNCFDIEADAITEMLENGTIDQKTADWYMRVAQQTVFHYRQSGWKQFVWFFKFQIFSRFSLSKKARKARRIRKTKIPKNINREDLRNQNQAFWSKLAKVEAIPYKQVVKYLSDNFSDNYTREMGIVRRSYDEHHRRLNNSSTFAQEQDELLIQAFQQEYNYIQSQAAAKKYSNALSNALYEQISNDQLVYIQSVSVGED